MSEDDFIIRNAPQWRALEAYNKRLTHGGVRKLPPDDVRAFAGLFRLAGYHLAYAQTHYPNGDILPYLNGLVGVAHNHFYIRENGSINDVKNYIRRTFPQAVRNASVYFFTATALFMLGVLLAAAYVAAEPDRLYQIMPGALAESGAGWDYPLMSAAIMANNIGVAVTAFALGLLGGVGTVFVLFYNGIVVGGLTGYIAATGGDGVTFLSLLLPHGFLELAAIFLSGACGLMIGKAVLIPGDYTRKHALIAAARKAAVMIPGIVVMLVVAGLIEGFFTPLDIAASIKLAFAGLTLVGLLVYLLRSGQTY